MTAYKDIYECVCVWHQIRFEHNKQKEKGVWVVVARNIQIKINIPCVCIPKQLYCRMHEKDYILQ